MVGCSVRGEGEERARTYKKTCAQQSVHSIGKFSGSATSTVQSRKGENFSFFSFSSQNTLKNFIPDIL